MQKKIIALAVAALASGAALAQSNVTVYGVADLGQAFVKSSTATAGTAGQGTVGRLDNNSSYLGFKGTEDLGNGLKAVFQFEVGYNSDNAGAGTQGAVGFGAGRDSFVGLAGDFGTVVAGNLTHPLRAFGAKVELAPGAAGFGTLASVTGTIAGTKTGADDRAANAIAYVSPTFSGFSATVAYVNGEQKTDSTQSTAILRDLAVVSGTGTVRTTTVGNNVNAKQWQVAAQYENGPLWVGAGYHKAIDFGYTEGQDAKVWRLAATYLLPTNTKLTALYDNTKVTNLDGSWDKRGAWSLAAAQSFGKNTIGLEYARSGDVDTESGKADQTGVKITSLIYTYGLSKRTAIHARYSKLTNDSNVAAAFYNNPVANPVALAPGSDSTGYMVGLRHNF